MMFHSLHKEASQVLCDAVQVRTEDEEEAGLTDSAGNPLRADRWWSTGNTHIKWLHLLYQPITFCVTQFKLPKHPVMERAWVFDAISGHEPRRDGT